MNRGNPRFERRTKLWDSSFTSPDAVLAFTGLDALGHQPEEMWKEGLRRLEIESTWVAKEELVALGGC